MASILRSFVRTLFPTAFCTAVPRPKATGGDEDDDTFTLLPNLVTLAQADDGRFPNSTPSPPSLSPARTPPASPKSLQLALAARLEALDTDPDAAVETPWTPRSQYHFRCFFPRAAAPTSSALTEPFSDDGVGAAQCLRNYLPAAVAALVANPAKPLPFVPPTYEIAEYLLLRVEAWAAPGAPHPGVAPILAGCDKHLHPLHDARRLQSLIEAERANDLAPSEETFLRFNLLLGVEADGSRLAWLTATEAGWLLQYPHWSKDAWVWLAARAGG